MKKALNLSSLKAANNISPHLSRRLRGRSIFARYPELTPPVFIFLFKGFVRPARRGAQLREWRAESTPATKVSLVCAYCVCGNSSPLYLHFVSFAITPRVHTKELYNIYLSSCSTPLSTPLFCIGQTSIAASRGRREGPRHIVSPGGWAEADVGVQR